MEKVNLRIVRTENGVITELNGKDHELGITILEAMMQSENIERILLDAAETLLDMRINNPNLYNEGVSRLRNNQNQGEGEAPNNISDN